MRVDANNAFDTILAPDNGAVPVAPKPSDYMDDFKTEEGFEKITDEQALEYLQSIFDVMSGFANIGYGLEPVQKMIKDFEITAKDKRILVSYKDAQDE